MFAALLLAIQKLASKQCGFFLKILIPSPWNGFGEKKKMKKDVQDLYQKLVKETISFIDDEKDITLDDILTISSAVVCFAVDLIRNNTNTPDNDIKAHLEDAIGVALLPEDELDELASQEEDLGNINFDTKPIDKKLLN